MLEIAQPQDVEEKEDALDFFNKAHDLDVQRSFISAFVLVFVIAVVGIWLTRYISPLLVPTATGTFGLVLMVILVVVCVSSRHVRKEVRTRWATIRHTDAYKQAVHHHFHHQTLTIVEAERALLRAEDEANQYVEGPL